MDNIKDFSVFGMSFFSWDNRNVMGFYDQIRAGFYGAMHGQDQKQLKVGQLLRCKMESGRNAIFRLIELEYMSDPKDQYFGRVEDVGYGDEL